MSTKLVIKTLILALLTLGLNSCLSENESDSDDESTLVEDLTVPPPTNLVATVASCTRVNLTWDAVAGATKYILLRGTAPGNEISYTTLPPTPTSFSDGHLVGNEQLSYEVKAVIGASISTVSNQVVVTTPACTVLPPPTTVTATAISSSRITVTWNAVAGATKYLIFMAQGAGAFNSVGSVLAPTTTFTIAGLLPNTTYNFKIRSVDANGVQSADSAVASATTFALGLEGYWKFDEHGGTTALDASGFNRTGTLNGTETEAFALPKAPLDGNKSYISSPGAATDFVGVPNTSSFNLSSTEWSVVFWVRLPTAPTAVVRLIGMRAAACGAVGWEVSQDSTNHLAFRAATVRSSGQDLVAGAWTHVGVTYGSSTIRLYINGALATSGAFTVGNHLAVPLQIGNAGSCAQGGPIEMDETQLYSRQLSDAEVAAFGTVPPAPTNLTVAVINASQENLSWTAVSGATKYLIFMGTAAGNEAFITSSPATPTTFDDGHLMPSTQYSWQVEAVRSGLISAKSNEVIATTSAGPAAPTGVTATPLSTSRISVAWSAVTGAVKYQVFQSVGGGAFTLRGSVTTLTFTDANLTTMTAYTYEVKAFDAANNPSPFSAPVTATTN